MIASEYQRQRPHTRGGQRFLSLLMFPSMPSSVHRAVMAGFPDGGNSPRSDWGILYRLEPDGSVLVQSAIEPNWGRILPSSAYQTRVMTYAVATGERYLFRMAINPVVVQRGRRTPTTAEAWLGRRDLGADLVIQNVAYATHHDRSGSGCRVVTEVATVSGLLTVTNPDRLMDILHNGIGRGRAYGAGLLSIIPAET